MNLTDVLKDELVYGSTPTPDAPMYIAFGVDANFIQPMGVAMTSILDHDTGGGIEFHVFSDARPSDDDAGRFARTMDKHGARCVWHVIDPSSLKSLPTISVYISVAAYYRFVASDYFYRKSFRYYYVDADVICRSDLRNMYNTPFENGKTIAAVRDSGITAEIPQLLGMVGTDYFFDGGILVDVNAWHEQNITSRAISLLTDENILGKLKNTSWHFMDQDALNILYEGQAVWLPTAYNTISNATDDYPPDTAIVHYAGPKPWYRWYEGREDNLFRQCQARSAWADVPIITEPRNPTECRKTSRAC